jgi:hypothetical protein
MVGVKGFEPSTPTSRTISLFVKFPAYAREALMEIDDRSKSLKA